MLMLLLTVFTFWKLQAPPLVWGALAGLIVVQTRAWYLHRQALIEQSHALQAVIEEELAKRKKE